MRNLTIEETEFVSGGGLVDLNVILNDVNIGFLQKDSQNESSGCCCDHKKDGEGHGGGGGYDK